MSFRLAARFVAATFLMSLLPAGAAQAAQLNASPMSHGAGFSSVACHIVNVSAKPVVVNSFFIEPIVTTVNHANTFAGCNGAPPYTIQPGQGCTRRMTDPSICNQLDACYCYANVSGSAKAVRGTMIGTVNGGTTVITHELRVK